MRSEIDALARRVAAHVGRYVGPIGQVFHWPGPEIVHVDVLHVPPTLARPWHTLLTCGMSQRPMCPPPEAQECRYAELYLSLPPGWPVGPERREEASLWPLRELSYLARYPHVCETWLWVGHTVASGDPPRRITPGAGFTAWILGPHLSLGHDGCIFRHRGRRIQYHSVLPIYTEELALARRWGSRALFERLAASGASDVIEIGRANVGKGWRRV